MKEFIDKLIERLEELRDRYLDNYASYSQSVDYGKTIGLNDAIEIVNQLAEEYKIFGNSEQVKVSEMPTGWIPCERELPPMPKENPLFENKPLELYLVSLNSTDYPWRAFWNGKFFTDGWSKVEVIAWMPLPPAFTEGE